MDTSVQIRNILRDALSLGDRANLLALDTPLLGTIPELDSMAVVQIIAMIESECGISIDDDELSADVFATFGTLVHFVSEKSAA